MRGKVGRPHKILLLFLLAVPAWGQFQLAVVEGGTERVASALYDFGSIYANELATTQFRLRNVSAAPARVTTLSVAGTGFSLTAAALPVMLAPQDALNFSVAFRAQDTGTYSAALRSDGVSILLTATVLPRMTLGGSFDFGSVVRGSSVQHTFTLTNLTPQTLTVPAISVQGTDFSVAGTPPSGQAYQPQQGGAFTIVFAPRSNGPSQGTLLVGDRSYFLTGTGADPPLPKPFLTLDLKQIASAQQGLVIIRFDTPATISGSGSVTLDFRGPADSTVAFATGGRTFNFTVAPGDTQVSVAFQTGTTAGTLVFNAQIGSATDQLTLPISNAPTGIAAAQGTRASSSVEVDVTGFDNTRTIGALVFTFYDSTGSVLTPGGIQINTAADFTKYFSGTDLGGAFLLRAIFPVTGDTSTIAACDVSVTNSTGTTKAPRISF